MSSTEIDLVSLRHLITTTVRGDDFCRATFAGPKRGDAPFPWVRVTLRPVELRGGPHLQFTYFDGKKTVTHNFIGQAIAVPLDELLNAGFGGIHLGMRTEEIDIRTTKKGKVFVGRKPLETPLTVNASHNRVKDVPLPEGRENRLLETMGILKQGGQVRPTMRAKYTQINEFLRQIEYVVEEAKLRDLGRPLTILDCGCGSSYLTLAAHHYMNDILGLPATILGVDVNEEVIRKSVAKAERWGANGLTFECGRIGNIETKADIVLALHACDTATDDAIAQAIRHEARVLLSVPCCHHHLNAQLRAQGAAEVLRPLLRHGILHERTADLVTDAFRASALRIMGYRTDVLEFISVEHTARNLMIRAIKGAPVGEVSLVNEYADLRRFWGVKPHIETALGNTLTHLVDGPVVVTHEHR